MTSIENKVSRKRKISDADYFRSYAGLGIHQQMIDDEARTLTYRQAILRNYPDIHGKVVADIGAGTGILSVFCVHAGAKKVYAIEGSSMAVQAKNVVEENGMQDRIEVISGKVEDIELPEKVDIIVSEWMGYFLLYETMLPSVLHARDKWLKEDGLMLPSQATLFLAPYADPGEFEERVSFWQDVESRYKVKMSCLSSVSRTDLTKHVHVQPVNGEDVVAKPVEICHLDLKDVCTATLKNVESDFEFKCYGCNRVYGFTAWFTVTFPGGTVLSTSPDQRGTHWQQCVLYFDEPITVVQDTCIKGNISLQPNKTYNRHMDISLTYSVDGKTPVTLQFEMNDEVP